MKNQKILLLIVLIFGMLELFAGNQRLRIPKGSYKISKLGSKIPANCIDRLADLPPSDYSFTTATKSIKIVIKDGNKLIKELSFDEALDNDVIKAFGNYSDRDFDIRLLKDDEYDYYLVSEDSKGVIGGINEDGVEQSFNDLDRLFEISNELEVLDETYIDHLSQIGGLTNVTSQIDESLTQIEWSYRDTDYEIEDISKLIGDLKDKILLGTKNHKILINDRAYVSLKNDMEEIIQDDVYMKHLWSYETNLVEGRIYDNDFLDSYGEMMNQLVLKSDKFTKIQKGGYKYFEDYNNKGANRIILYDESYLADSWYVKRLFRKNRTPLLVKEKYLLDNIDMPPEKFKFIVTGSSNVQKNMELFESVSEDHMNAYTKTIQDIQSNTELSEHFVFVESKDQLNQALENNSSYKTVTFYHNHTKNTLFDEAKENFNLCLLYTSPSPRD